MTKLRHDIRAPAGDRFGKPGSSFPYGTQDFPRVTEEGTVRKGKVTQAFLTPHPDNPDLLLVAVQRAKGDDTDAVESRVYEKVPGPQIVSTGYNERGESTTTITQTVLNNSEPPVDLMGYLYDSASKVAQDALRSTLTVTTVDQRSPLYTEEAFTVNRTLMRHTTGTLRTTKNEIVPVGSDAETGFLVVGSTVQDKNKWQSVKITTRVDAFTTLTSTERDLSFGGILATKTETIVATGTTAPALSGDMYESTVEDLDGTHALQTIKEKASGETWPTFVTKKLDNRMGVIVAESRTIKQLSQIVPGYHIAGDGSELTVVEIEPFTRNQSLAWEVTTVYPLPPAHSFETAILGQTWDATDFPARLMTTTAYSYEWDSATSQRTTNTTNKEVVPPTAKLVPATTHRWYVFSETKPTIEVSSIVLPPQEYESMNSSYTGSNGKHGNSKRTSIGEFLSSVSSPTDGEYLGYSYVSASYTLTENSNIVTGVNTNFVNDFKAGDILDSYSGYQSVNSANVGNVALSEAFYGPTGVYIYRCFYTTGAQSYEYELLLTHGSATVTINSQTLIASAVGSFSGVFWNVNAVVATVADNTHLTLVNPWYGSSAAIAYNSKETYTGTSWVGQEKIRKANVERLKPGLYECNAISVLMR